MCGDGLSCLVIVVQLCYEDSSLCVCVFFQAGDSPHLLSVPVTWVKEGGMVRLDKKYLQVDYKGVSTDNIVYTILASDGQPKYGTVFITFYHLMPAHRIHFRIGLFYLFKDVRPYSQTLLEYSQSAFRPNISNNES